jgi:hypothetical protein
MALGRALVTERLRRAAETDGLTNVANQRTFDAAIARTAQRAHDGQEPYAVILVDLDHFRQGRYLPVAVTALVLIASVYCATIPARSSSGELDPGCRQWPAARSHAWRRVGTGPGRTA